MDEKVGFCFGCEHRFPKETMYVCSWCKAVSYCGRDCQKKHRREHKILCQFIAKHKEDGSSLFEGYGMTRSGFRREISRKMQLYLRKNNKLEDLPSSSRL